MQQPAKYFSERLNSTNLYAAGLLSKQTKKEPFWIRTDEQFAGRGQGSRTWVTEPGKNLTGSLVVFPEKFGASEQFVLSKTFALAALDFLELFIDDVSIKWPNDLYAKDKKIGGILIETAILGKYIAHAILGIGLNINQLQFSKNIPNPISLRLLTNIEYDLVELEAVLIDSFLNKYALIETGLIDKINNQYLDNLYRFEEFASFKAGEETFIAKITGVSEYGHLIVQTESGDVRTFAYQEVEYLLNS